MAEKNEPISNTADRELVITRLLNAPRELVFEVWTDTKHIVNWWGPNGFTTTIYSMDVKPGGEWNFMMHGPDGTDYKNESIYIDVVKPERIVYDHVNGPKFRATVTFTEQDGKTLLTMQMIFDTVSVHERVVKEHKADVGQKQTIDRMEAYLADIERNQKDI